MKQTHAMVLIAAAASLCCSVGTCLAQATGLPKESRTAEATAPASRPAADLGPRYFDPLHGFSLRPPASSLRSREPSPTRLVNWMARDEKTGAVVWMLSILRKIEAGSSKDLPAFARTLPETLAKVEGFHVDGYEVVKAADKPAIDLRGTLDSGQRWQRQLWVQADEDRFVVLQIAGPSDMKATLDGVLQSVAGTLELNDPRAALEAREANLKNGEKFLDSITESKLSAVIVPEQWFVLSLNGRNVGFMVQAEAPSGEKGAGGLTVTTWLTIELPNDQPRLMKRIMFTSPDRSLEQWRQQIQVGSGQMSMVLVEQGLKQGNLIICHSGAEGRLKTQKKDRVLAPIYLPHAMSYLLPRLVDLTKPAGYAFAVYTAEANDFDMRTLTIVGPARLRVGDKTVDVVKATDQPAADVEASTIWVDGKGLLLRVDSPDGLLMEAAPRAEVTKRFPKADGLVEAMNKWPKLE